MVSELEINIAEKVREIHGPRMWEEGDRYIHDEQVLFVGKFHYSGAIVTPHEDSLWLPTQMDYMDLLWEIDADRFILADDGVYEGETHYEGDTWTFKYDNRYDSPREAWWRVINNDG